MTILRLAVLVTCATLLVMGHWIADLDPSYVSDKPVIVLPDDDMNLAVWSQPHRKLELQVLPSWFPAVSGADDFDETYVRPAWGIFTAVVVCFFLLWTTVEHGGAVGASVIAPLF